MGWTRRLFLTTLGTGSAALLIGGGALLHRRNRLLAFRPPLAAGESHLGPWLKIAADGSVIVLNARAEMGQGALATMAIIVAEEMGAEHARIRFEDAPAVNVYRNVIATVRGLPIHVPETGVLRSIAEGAALQLGISATGGSTTATDSWFQLRAIAASARSVLVNAAARRWGADPASCDSIDSSVLHADGKTRLSFAELAADAAALEMPAAVTLRDPAKYRFVGKSPPRPDLPSKVDGSARFGIDVRLPGLRYAAIRQSPVFGARVASVKETAAFRAPGVETFVDLGDAVAVIANSWWSANRALNALQIEYIGGTADTAGQAIDDAELFAAYARALDEPGRAHVFETAHDLEAAKARSISTLSAEYRVPLLAHACMEPLNATAQFHDGQLRLWCGNQAPTLFRERCANALGIDIDAVQIHGQLLGGGFGRRADPDYAVQAALIAKARPGDPIQLIWSREEDLQHDFYRPSALARYEAGLATDGSIAYWHARSGHPSVRKAFMGRNFPYLASQAPDRSAVESAAGLAYDLGDRQIEYAHVETRIPVGNWRSVNHSQNGFFLECFIDELAEAGGQDPLAFRRRLLRHAPRHLAVLDRVAQMSGWGATDSGRARACGIAIVASFRSIVAQVVEVSGTTASDPGSSPGQALRVERVWAAVDCGLAIDPRNVIAQVRSAVVMGLTAALYGEINIDQGRVRQQNFHDYRMLKLADSPPIEVELVDQGSDMGGVGEIGVPPSMPALANAFYRVTGKRVRTLPLIRALA